MIKNINLLLLLCGLGLSLTLNAQKHHEIKGVITDSLGEPLLGSTIMLLDTDSTFVDFSRSELDGTFRFKKVPVGEHILKITFIGMIPVNKNIISQGDAVDLGQIKMKEIPKELMEIVIKAARAPIKLRGDTIEYDATTFKVPEGSTVEDLLRRLPGMDVGQDGEIKADGQNVTKVTVDGKEFFGGDPKAATKNLEADAISKVQVFDKKSEEEEITGDNSKVNNEKTLNLELKDSHKDGSFGKVIVGAGTKSRAEVKGNYNRFNEKIQFSLIGGANNTGRNGLSWNDYRGFMGSQAWSFGDDDDYGFGSGGMGMIIIGGRNDENSLENSLQSIFFSRGDNGLPQNVNGGINFGYNHKKTKISSYYFINQKDLRVIKSGSKETFLDNGNIREQNSSSTFSSAIGQKGEVKWEQEIDSFHTIVFKTQLATVDNGVRDTSMSTSRFAKNKYNTNSNSYRNNRNSDGYLVNGRMLLKKKFRSSKRRRMGLNASYQYSTINEDQVQRSTNDFFDEMGLTAQQAINQNYDNAYSKALMKINALHVEPLTDRISFQAFYNHSNRQETGNRDVIDIEGSTETINALLTRDYENDITLNRVGGQLKYGHNGFNLSIGAAYQDFILKGIYEGVKNSGIMGQVNNHYRNWIPHASISFSPFRNAHVDISYDVSAREPSIRNLQPIVDNSNPLYIREGNPDLLPEISHGISGYMHYSKPLSGFRVFVNISHGFFRDQIITRETVSPELITKVIPVNHDGGSRTSSYLSMGFPVVKSKVKMSMGMSMNIDRSNAFVNDLLNTTRSNSYTPRVGMDITPSDKFSLFINTRWRMTNTSYNLNSKLNQKSKNFTHSVEMNADLFAGLKLNTNLDLTMFRNDRLNLSQDVPIWNVSIYKQFLKGNKAEVRLSVYDVLNKNIAINQWASNYFITESRTETLTQYAMLSFTYNLKGIGTKKRRMMF